MKNNIRGLSVPFIHDLKCGLLNLILERVIKDPTLCLEIREDYINIYYRGGNLIRIEKKDCYVASFDTNYGVSKCQLPKKEICDKDDVERWVAVIPLLKQAMDIWFGKHPKEERECQQVVLRENNGSVVGNSTDYFIVDIEYDNHDDARFDLIAIKWESEGSIRKLKTGYSPKLCFIEMKYGDGALSGKAGMTDHIRKFKNYIDSNGLETIKKEMLGVFKQKRDLGLIAALKNNKNEVKEFAKNVDFMFLLANHDPASCKLRDALNEISKEYGSKDLGFNLTFCTSNFMGYGIYKENVYTLPEFMKLFRKQISCNS